MSTYDNIKESITENRKLLGQIGAGVYEGVSSVVPSVLNRQPPHFREPDDRPLTASEFVANTQELAAEMQLRHEEGRKLTEMETLELLKSIEKTSKGTKKQKVKTKNSTTKVAQTSSKTSQIQLQAHKGQPVTVSKKKNYLGSTRIEVVGNEKQLLESTFKVMNVGLMSLAKINSQGFTSLAHQLANHREVIIYGSAMRAFNLQQLYLQVNNVLTYKNKESLFTLGNNQGMDDFIQSNLSTSFYLNKLAELYRKDQGVFGTVKKLIKNPAQTLLQQGLKSALPIIDKNNIVGNLNDIVKSLPGLVLDGAENGKFSELKNKYLGKLYKLPFVGRGLEEFNPDELLRHRVFSGKNLEEYLSTTTENTVDKSTTVGFDAQTHNSINVVITGYLAELYEALTGVSLVHDYRSGKWHTADELRTTMKEAGKDRLFNRSSKLVYGLYAIENMDEATKKAILYDIVQENLDTPEKLQSLKAKYQDQAANLDNFINELDTSHLKAEVRLGRMVLKQEAEHRFKGTSAANVFNHTPTTRSGLGGGSTTSEATPVSKFQVGANLQLDKMEHISKVTEDILELLQGIKLSKDRWAYTQIPKEEVTYETLPDSSKAQKAGGQYQEVKVDTEYHQEFKATPSEEEHQEEAPVSEPEVEATPTSTATPKQKTTSTEGTEGEGSASPVEEVMDNLGIENPLNGYNEVLDTVDDATNLVEKLSPKSAEKIKGVTQKLRPTALKNKFFSSKLGMKLKGSKIYGKATKLMSKSGKLTAKASQSVAKLSSKFTNTIAQGKVIPKGMVSNLIAKGANLAKSTGIVQKLGGTALGKAGGQILGKIGSKFGGKMLGKVAGKAAGKLLSLGGGPVGWAIFAITSLPDIINFVKHPIETLKHPFQAIGSLFGLTESPGETYEREQKEKAASKAQHGSAEAKDDGSPLGSILGGAAILALAPALMLGGSLLGITKLFRRYTTAGILSSVEPATARVLIGTAKEYERNEAGLAQRVFDNTLVGSLYNLADGKTRAAGKLGRKFSQLFSAFGGGVAPTNVTIEDSGSSEGDSESTKKTLKGISSKIASAVKDSVDTSSSKGKPSNVANTLKGISAKVAEAVGNLGGESNSGSVNPKSGLAGVSSAIASAAAGTRVNTGDGSAASLIGNINSGGVNGNATASSLGEIAANITHVTPDDLVIGTTSSSAVPSQPEEDSQPDLPETTVPDVPETTPFLSKLADRVLPKVPFPAKEEERRSSSSVGERPKSYITPTPSPSPEPAQPPVTTNTFAPSTGNSISQPVERIYVTGGDKKLVTKVQHILQQTSTTIINNYYGPSSTAENGYYSDPERGRVMIAMQDILTVTQSLGTDILQTGEEFKSMLTRVTSQNTKHEKGKELATKRVTILTSLAAISALAT